MLKLFVLLLLGSFLCGSEGHTEQCTPDVENLLKNKLSELLPQLKALGPIPIGGLLGLSLSLEGSFIELLTLELENGNIQLLTVQVVLTLSLSQMEKVKLEAYLSVKVNGEIKDGCHHWNILNLDLVDIEVKLLSVNINLPGISVPSILETIKNALKDTLKLLLQKAVDSCNDYSKFYTATIKIAGNAVWQALEAVTYGINTITTKSSLVVNGVGQAVQDIAAILQATESSCTTVHSSVLNVILSLLKPDISKVLDKAALEKLKLDLTLDGKVMLVIKLKKPLKCDMSTTDHKLIVSITATLNIDGVIAATLEYEGMVSIEPVTSGGYVGITITAAFNLVGKVTFSTPGCGCAENTGVIDSIVNKALTVEVAKLLVDVKISINPAVAPPANPATCTKEMEHYRCPCQK